MKTSMGMWVGLCGAIALVAGCAGDPKKPSARPGPSEANEDYLVGGEQADAPVSEIDAEEAATKAAAEKVMAQVKDRDPEQERKKLENSRKISRNAQGKLSQGKLGDAIKTAREALKVHEQNVDAMLVIAEVYYKQGKYELVQAVTSSALQVDAKIRTPAETSRAYNLQGFAVVAMGEDFKATQLFKKAAEADENNAGAWNNLGTRYLDAGDVATAISCFQYALELEPRFFKAHLNYGAALRANRQWEEAEAAINQALKLRPNYAEAHFNLGVLYLDADPFPGLETGQRLNKAITHLKKFQQLAVGDGVIGPDRRKLPGAKSPPARVSKDRADDYIRVANKGLEKEARAQERAKEREATPAEEPAAAGGDPGAATPADDPGAAQPGEPTPAEPAQPGAVEPAQPSPQGPGEPTPAEPTPEQPSPESPASPTPEQPSPQGPASPAPKQPSPQGPASPAPEQPSPQGPAKPAPEQPAPQGPSQPAPQKPQAPAKPAPEQPAPQQPTPQQPKSASVLDGATLFPVAYAEKNPLNFSSRGTRLVPATLISVGSGATCFQSPNDRPAVRCTSATWGDTAEVSS